jgi:hypothetical protein
MMTKPVLEGSKDVMIRTSFLEVQGQKGSQDRLRRAACNEPAPASERSTLQRPNTPRAKHGISFHHQTSDMESCAVFSQATQASSRSL